MNKTKVKRLYENYDYEAEYDKQIKNLESYEDLRINSNYVYVVKTIVSGEMVEKEIYPVWKCKGDMPRGDKRKKSRKAQENLNNKNKIKWAIRLINTNFNNGDLYITLTHRGKAPDKERAKKDVENYLKRIRRWWNKNKPGEEFKYIHVIDFVDDPEKSKRTKIHHHLIMSGMDRDIAEEKWGLGTANANRLQADELKFEKVARYIASQSKTRIGYSKNLKKPIVTINRTTLTRRKVEKIAINENIQKEFFENKFKNLSFIDCKTYISDEFSGIYIYTKMRKRK
ncbi:rolling circle replication-associated protein [Clostridium nigeriense]|uniref:rolling circle replication-associated protein n=1 Tax=Clostridium nigeriense TaxID=1805470 RepID=UPI003D328A70